MTWHDIIHSPGEQHSSPSNMGPTTPKPAVRIIEVGPRDGLQNIPKTVPTSVKVELIRRLARAGLRTIEATSFVSPRWIPQLADNKDVLRQVMPLARGDAPVSLPVLVPNLRGLDDALAHGVEEVAVFVSASEGFSRNNVNCGVDEALARAREVATKARRHGFAVRGSVSITSNPSAHSSSLLHSADVSPSKPATYPA